MPANRTHADIPGSFFEYYAAYQEPLLDLHRFYSQVPQVVFRGLREFNLTLENVSHKQNPPNLGEVASMFALFGGRAVFTTRLNSASLWVTNPNWSELELFTRVIKAAMAAILGIGVRLEKQRATIGVHLKPLSGSLKQFVSGLARPTAKELLTDDVRTFGVSVYREDSTWVVDASVLDPQALFVRVDNLHDPSVAFEEIASKLKADEIRLLELLQLEVD